MVAQLQGLVWRACSCPFSAQGFPLEKSVTAAAVTSGLSFYSREDWKEASALLLTEENTVAQRRASPRVGGGGAQNGQPFPSPSAEPSSLSTSLLWSHVFRTAFLRQMERLLGSTRAMILEQTTAAISDSLTTFGVQLSITNGGGEESGEIHPSVPVSVSVRVTATATAAVPISSTALFHQAEVVRSGLEASLRAMVQGLGVPVMEESQLGHGHGGDGASAEPQSSDSLSLAARIQSCTLLGQLLALLRTLVESITGQLSTIPKQRTITPAHREALTASLLFVGRLCWLFTVSGRFLDETIEGEDGLSRLPGTRSSTDSNVLVNLEQLRSAFDIAETGGGGVVSLEEAREVSPTVTRWGQRVLNLHYVYFYLIPVPLSL